MGEGQNKKKSIPTLTYRRILAVMVMFFIFYNVVVYSSSSKNPLPLMSKQAIRGELLWQENNCTSCHQLYGLGGYMGPDLTNIVSKPTKGPVYLKAFLNSGVKAMPSFNFTEGEKDDIVAFLSHVDATGFFPNNNSELESMGWVKLKYKTFKNAEIR